MTVRQLVAALLASCEEDFDRQVYLSPNADPVDAVEACPGNATYDLDPYIVIRGAGAVQAEARINRVLDQMITDGIKDILDERQ